jgi:hypothetical protein
MEGFISHGEEWMKPLAELRDFLMEAWGKPGAV